MWIDHNHNNNQVRGLLCGKCNFLIGLAQEDKNILTKAIKYLEKFNTIDNVIILGDTLNVREK